MRGVHCLAVRTPVCTRAEDEWFDSESLARSYGRLLRTAQQSDLSDIEAIGFCKPGPRDRQGRPTLMVVGAALLEDEAEQERCALLAVRLLDEIAESEYGLVYIHTRW
jgi:hypothetical protein